MPFFKCGYEGMDATEIKISNHVSHDFDTHLSEGSESETCISEGSCPPGSSHRLSQTDSDVSVQVLESDGPSPDPCSFLY